MGKRSGVNDLRKNREVWDIKEEKGLKDGEVKFEILKRRRIKGWRSEVWDIKEKQD